MKRSRARLCMCAAVAAAFMLASGFFDRGASVHAQTTRPAPTTQPDDADPVVRQVKRLVEIHQNRVTKIENGVATGQNTPVELLRARVRLTDARARLAALIRRHDLAVREWQLLLADYEKALARVRKLVEAGQMNATSADDFEAEVIEVRIMMLKAAEALERFRRDPTPPPPDIN